MRMEKLLETTNPNRWRWMKMIYTETYRGN
jgi:hypothetical protein